MIDPQKTRRVVIGPGKLCTPDGKTFYFEAELPSSDPNQNGRLWVDGDILKVSRGTAPLPDTRGLGIRENASKLSNQTD